MTPFDPKTTFESWGNFSIGKLQALLGIARVVDLLKLSLQKNANKCRVYPAYPRALCTF